LPRLCLAEIGRTYGEHPPIVALSDIWLTVDQGEFLAIQGPSGSGKSSLLNIIGLIDGPTAGRYTIDGADTAWLSERERAALRGRTFGFVFQSFHLMPRRSALQNVELGLVYRGVGRAGRRERAAHALARVGLEHRAGLAAGNLSGGERQRVAIARAIIGDAHVVVADEPTGNLDTETSRAIVGELEDLHRSGKTVIIVTHDPEVAAVAERRVLLRDGRIEADRTRAAEASVRRSPALLTANAASAAAVDADRMRAGDMVAEALHAMEGRPGRAAALTAAVGVAVALIVATAGLAQTASSQVSDRFDARLNREVTVSAPPTQGLSEDLLLRQALGRAAEGRVRSLAGVKSAGVLGNFDQRSVRAIETSRPQHVPLMGVSAGLLATARARIAWVPGHPHRLGARELLVGAIPAKQLELAPLEADPTVLVDGVPFGVVGIIRGIHRAPELLASIAASQREASSFGDPARTQLLIETVAGAAPQVARQAPVAVDPVFADKLEVRAPVDPRSLREEIQSDLTTTLVALTLVAAIASLIGVANAMMMSVIERIGELGLRRAIGARPVHILGQTSLEALLLGVGGGVLGFLLGTGGVLVVTVLNRWQPVLELRLVPVALAGGALVGVAGGLAAAVRASRIQPSDALRR
jgi:macrolide transport system ATP-binding/permease protein